MQQVGENVLGELERIAVVAQQQPIDECVVNLNQRWGTSAEGRERDRSELVRFFRSVRTLLMKLVMLKFAYWWLFPYIWI
jgi:hypothetical protein